MKRIRWVKPSAVLVAALGLWAGAARPTWGAEPERGLGIVVTADHPDGSYAAGQPIHWRIELTGPVSSNITQVDYVLKKGGLTVATRGRLALTNGVGQLECSLAEPGSLLLEIQASGGEGGSLRGLGGAVVAPEKISPSAERPADFDEFWKLKLEELSKVPVSPQLVAGESGKPEVDYWQLTMDNIRGTHIHGQLARPRSPEKLPAVLVVQYAGVYPLQKAWVTDRAGKGWLALNINPHDLPIDEPADFYDKQFKGPLKNYWNIGNDERDKSYFLRMYLSCYRAAEYLAGRPDWDGKTLLVTGVSQGGLQTLMLAGLYPKVTAAIAGVPAGCDLTGPQAGRSPGWPGWYNNTQGKDAAKVIDTGRYYDVVNFASRIRCPVLVGIGLVDETCPPAGILAAMNQVKSPKEIVLLPHGDHQGKNNTHKTFNNRAEAWQKGLQQGRATGF